MSKGFKRATELSKYGFMEGCNMSFFFNTPLLRKEENKINGKTIRYKMDALQPTGSFKVRGMENAARKAAERGCKKLLSSSGGNAGMAVAFVGRSLGLPVKVVLPKSTPHSVAGALKNLGAAVEINGGRYAIVLSFSHKPRQ